MCDAQQSGRLQLVHEQGPVDHSNVHQIHIMVAVLDQDLVQPAVRDQLSGGETVDIQGYRERRTARTEARLGRSMHRWYASRERPRKGERCHTSRRLQSTRC